MKTQWYNTLTVKTASGARIYLVEMHTALFSYIKAFENPDERRNFIKSCKTVLTGLGCFVVYMPSKELDSFVVETWEQAHGYINVGDIGEVFPVICEDEKFLYYS